MIGRKLGRYEITGEVGRGGMGIVYKAIQTSLNRVVAVKMLPKQLANAPEFLSRFQREAETLARLQHENIVHIYDVEESDGDHFIVMEYVGGPSLARLLTDRGPFSPAAARDIAMLVASGLAAAHAQGIVHRDIKPDNILFSDTGQPKLTDFGIAHAQDGRVQTQTGATMGTPYYVSPEQARGDRVTPASDLYSLGIVLFEMLAGRRPFEGRNNVLVFLKHIEEPAPILTQTLGPAVSEASTTQIRISGFEALVARCLSKDAGKRPEGAIEFEEALRRLPLDAAPGSALRNLFDTAPSEAEVEPRPPDPHPASEPAIGTHEPDVHEAPTQVATPTNLERRPRGADRGSSGVPNLLHGRLAAGLLMAGALGVGGMIWALIGPDGSERENTRPQTDLPAQTASNPADEMNTPEDRLEWGTLEPVDPATGRRLRAEISAIINRFRRALEAGARGEQLDAETPGFGSELPEEFERSLSEYRELASRPGNTEYPILSADRIQVTFEITLDGTSQGGSRLTATWEMDWRLERRNQVWMVVKAQSRRKEG